LPFELVAGRGRDDRTEFFPPIFFFFSLALELGHVRRRGLRTFT
jgi:hypothetical protein